MAISRADFWCFMIESVTRNPNLGIPALEDGLFANLLIFNYLQRKGKGKGKEKGKGRERKREGNLGSPWGREILAMGDALRPEL